MTRKPHKTRDTKVTSEFEHGWNDMLKGIKKLKKILDGLPEPQFSPEDHINLYTTVYNLCTQKAPNDNSEQFYKKYKEEIETYVSRTLLPLIRGKYDEFMLIELVKRWKNHKVMVRWMSRFFQYLDRFYIARRALPPLYEVGMTCFREQLYQKLHNTVNDILVGLVAQDRDGEQIDRTLLKNVMDILVEIGMGITDYVNEFETYMLKDTATYYSRKASDWILKYSCPDYMLKAEECLKRERERVCHYLPGISEPKLVETVETELLVVHANQLLEKEQSGCLALLRDEKVDDLSRICSLYHKIPQGLELVSSIFKQHVTDEGLALVNQAIEIANNQVGKECGAHEQVLVRKIIELHDKHMVYLCNCFMNLSPFRKSFKEAFEIIYNKNVADRSSAELLATFCDNILKKGGSEKLSDEAIEDTLEKVVKLLAYVDGKDLFAEFYRKKLAHRLLCDKSASDEHERSMLTKMKQLCGGQFTSKMEGMVTDLTLAREDSAQFKRYLSILPIGIDFTVNVLNTAYWPTYRTSDLNLPAEMVRCVEAFKEYYQDKSRKRRLNWIHSLGNCNIIGNFDPKPIELVMSTYQGAVLLLFNNSDKLSYSDIKSQSNLGNDDLVRVLFTLSCAKYQILNKEPSTKMISPTDSFEFNPKFTDRMRRIVIRLPAHQERKKVVEDVDKDRRYIIDASIVRIMKSRKMLSHQQLNAQIVEQLRQLFKPDFKLIKKRIEDLINREYLERDRENPNMFRYLA